MHEIYKESIKTMYIILYNVAPGRNCVVNGPVRAGLWCVVVAGYVPGALAIYAIWQDLQHDILVDAPAWMYPFVITMIASGAILIGIGVAITRREPSQTPQPAQPSSTTIVHP